MKILFCAQDIAGGEAILPLIEYAEEKKLLIGGKSKSLFKDYIDAYIDADNDSRIYEKVEEFSPEVIVTGTSLAMSIEKKMIEFGRKKGIPSLSIVDHWANYSQRFENKKYLPDRICVIDELMKKEMIIKGFDEEIIRITGNPHFDNFNINSNNGKKHVLFISQAFTELGGINPGYDELVVIKDLIDIFHGYKLVVRPHPRGNVKKFNFVRGDAIIDTKSSIKDLISESEIIIGMSSNVLFQAFLNRKKVISYQPGLIGEDQCILAKLNLKQTITTKENLNKSISNINVDVDQKLIDKYTKNNSTEKVMREVRKLIS